MQNREDIFSNIHIGPFWLDEAIVLAEKEPLYRGSGLHFDDVFYFGFKAPGTNTDLVAHTFPTDGNDFFKDSAYISTSVSRESAIKFPWNLFPGNNRSYLYEIHSTKPTIDVLSEISHEVLNGRINLEDFNINLRFQERAFISRISPYEIKGGWEIMHRKVKIKNPSDLPFSKRLLNSMSDEVLEFWCYEKERNIIGSFVPNPNYRWPEKILIKTLKTTAGVGLALGIAVDGWSLQREYKISKSQNDYTNTYREITRISGGWTGAWILGSQSAKAGALVCSPIAPPFGSICCSFAGGLVGSGIGYFAGSKAATKIFDINWSGVYQNLDESNSKNYELTYKLKKLKRKINVLPNLFKATVNFHKTNYHSNYRGVKSMLNRTEHSTQHNGYIFGQLKPIFMAEESNRQDAELQNGRQLFNKAIEQDIRKDPIGAANLLATASVQLEIEKVKHRLDTISHVSVEHAVRSEGQLDKLLENNQELDQKLTTLIENNQEVRKQLLIVTENIQQQAEQKRIQENKQGLLDAAGFVSALGQHVGNKDICRMGTIVHSGITISKSLEVLQGLMQGPMSPAMLTPMSAIGLSVLSLISAFANKGPNMNKIMLDAIQSLANQVNEMRKEMHDRFDRIDNQLAKIYLRIIDGFCEIITQNKNIMEILIDIQNFLRDFKMDVKDYFSTVNETLRSIEDHLYIEGRQDKLRNIYKTIKKANSVHTPDAREFKDLYNELHAEICDLHQNNRLLVGGNSESVKILELDETNPFSADFNINILYDYLADNKQEKRPVLVNPIIWSWQVMGFMELLKRFYQKKEDAVKITKAELKELEEVPSIGNQTLNFQHSVRKQELMLQLLREHIQAGHLLEQELTLSIDKDEKTKTKELNQQLKKTLEYCAGLDAGSTFEEFKEEKIHFDTQAHHHWFTADRYNSHSNFGKSYEGVKAYGEATNIQTYLKDYVQGRQLSVDQKKSEIRKAAQTKLTTITNQFHYFIPSNLGENYVYSFMLPQNKIHPILPLPKNIFFPISQTLQMAQWLGLGYVQFQYQVQQVEAKHAVGDAKEKEKLQNFVIEGLWVSEKDRHILFSYSLPYDPGIYGYKQILMANEKTKLDEVNPKTILMHRNGVNLSAYWKINGTVHSKTMLAMDAKEISDVLPPPGKDTNDAALIRAIVAKYQCSPKENEAIWWWWVGGNLCRTGTTNISTVYSNTTHEQNTWTHEAYLPLCQETDGKRDTLELKNNDAKKVEFKAHISDDSPLIKQIQQHIVEKNMKMQEGLYEDLNKEIGNNSVSKLGKAFVTYSHTFYMLKSALTLAFGENVLKTYPEFRYFYGKTVLNNRLRFLSQLGSLGRENISLIEKLKKDLKNCEDQITPGLAKLFSEPHPDSILALVLKEWNVLMDWYKKNSVDENPICSSKSVEEMQREQLKTYGVLLSCLSNTYVNLSKESKSEFLKNMQQEMLKQGLVLTANAKGLLQFDLKSRGSSESKPNSYSLFPTKPIPNTLATDQGILVALQKKLGNTAHIINPALSSRSNLFSGGLEAAMEYAKEINGYIPIENAKEDKHSRTGFIYEDGGELKKPIVAILNTASVRAAHSADTMATGGSHWVAMVILPKHYKDLKNQNEKIFLLDSLNPERAFPPEFKKILTQGGIHHFSAPACEHANAPRLDRQHNILPAFPNAEFANLDEFKKQQIGYTDCGWWALDNALKIIESGTITEIMKDYNGPSRSYELRNEYPDLDKEQIQIVNRNAAGNFEHKK